MQPRQYDLVFEGGGAKGAVFVGAMEEFTRRGHTYDRLLGTSAGAITAALLAAGYSPDEMLAAVSEEQDGKPVFVTFMGPPPPFTDDDVKNSSLLQLLRGVDIPFVANVIEDHIDFWLAKTVMRTSSNLFSLVELGGWYSANQFLEWIKRKLNEGTFRGKPRNFGEMTMQQFYEATGHDLSLITSDTSGTRMLILNHNTTPDVPVIWAVRMSMSIPMVWPEVEWQAEWGQYMDRDITGHLMVDGGLLSNFPIELFVAENNYVTGWVGAKRTDQIIGMLIDETLEVPDAPQLASTGGNSYNFGEFRLIDRIQRLVNTATNAHDKMVIEAFEHLVVRLPAKDYGTVEFDMTDERREALLAAGRAAMKTYLDRIEAEEAAAVDMEEEGVSFGLPGEEVEIAGRGAPGMPPEVPPVMDTMHHANEMASKMLQM